MSKKVLTRDVHLGGVIYEAGTRPPKEIADKIKSPAAWGEVDEEIFDEEDDGGSVDPVSYEEASYRDLLKIARDRELEFHGNPSKEEVITALEESDGAD